MHFATRCYVTVKLYSVAGDGKMIWARYIWYSAVVAAYWSGMCDAMEQMADDIAHLCRHDTYQCLQDHVEHLCNEQSGLLLQTIEEIMFPEFTRTEVPYDVLILGDATDPKGIHTHFIKGGDYLYVYQGEALCFSEYPCGFCSISSTQFVFCCINIIDYDLSVCGTLLAEIHHGCDQQNDTFEIVWCTEICFIVNLLYLCTLSHASCVFYQFIQASTMVRGSFKTNGRWMYICAKGSQHYNMHISIFHTIINCSAESALLFIYAVVWHIKAQYSSQIYSYWCTYIYMPPRYAKYVHSQGRKCGEANNISLIVTISDITKYGHLVGVVALL